jgi:hypothetical protein
MAQLLLHLSDDLARRFKRTVAGRQRSRFVQRLLEEGLPPQELREDDPPYQTALAIEADAELCAEMEDRKDATLVDGLDCQPAEGKNPRVRRQGPLSTTIPIRRRDI